MANYISLIYLNNSWSRIKLNLFNIGTIINIPNIPIPITMDIIILYWLPQPLGIYYISI